MKWIVKLMNGEGGTSEVSLDSVDDIEDVLLDLCRIHLHHPRVGCPVLQIDSLVKQFQDSFEGFQTHHTKGNPRLSQEVDDGVIQLLAEFVHVLRNTILQPDLLWFSPAVIIRRTLLTRSLVDLVHLQELFVLVPIWLTSSVLRS